jgi:hypothetical protein
MIWRTFRTEAYAKVILRRVVEFLGAPDDMPAGVAKRVGRQAGAARPRASRRNLHGDARAHYELVSAGVDITDADELALHEKAFAALSAAAWHGDAAKELIGKALGFWSRAGA